MRQITYCILLILFISAVASKVQSQDFISGPSTSTLDSKALLGNPALISFQRPQVALGIKTHYSGFSDSSESGFRQGYFVASLPGIRGSRFGAAAHARYFNSPIFTRSQLSSSFSVRLWHRVSIGVTGSLHHVGYNRDNFVDFDFGDPVFQNGYSRNTFNSAAGIYARPLSNVELALGARNLNEPDISLSGNGVKEPLEFFGALSYRYDIVRGTVEFVNDRYGLDTRVHLEAFSTEGYFARMGTNMSFDRGYIEAQMHVYGGVSINYQFEMPFNDVLSETYGSHMFSLVYEFNRVSPLPQRRPAAVAMPEVARSRTDAVLPSAIVLTSSTDHLEYKEVTLTRRIDTTTVTEEDLLHLTAYDIGNLDHQQDYYRMPYSGRRPDTAPLPAGAAPEPVITDNYRNTLDFIRDHILSNDRMMELVVEDGTQVRAAGLREQFRRQSGRDIPVSVTYRSQQADSMRHATPVNPELLADQQVTVLTPENALIRPVNATGSSASEWALRIYAANGQVINEIQGASDLPDIIEWNWQLADGSIIPPGLYTYSLHWADDNGFWQETRSRYLYVQKITRNITIDISKDLEKIHSDPDRIELILKNK